MQYATYKPHLVGSGVFLVFYCKESPFVPYLLKAVVTSVNNVNDKNTYYGLLPVEFISGTPGETMTLRCINKEKKSKEITMQIDPELSLNWVQQFALNYDGWSLDVHQWGVFDNINDACDLINKLNNNMISELTEATGKLINQNNEIMKIRYGI